MNTRDSWQEESVDISLALEEEALILTLFGQLLLEGNGTSAPKEVQARLLYSLSDYLNQHATDLKLLSPKKE